MLRRLDPAVYRAGRGAYCLGLRPPAGAWTMKDGIHPKYYPDCKVYYRGEVVMTTGATVPELTVEIWSGSHPYYTGQKTFVDTAGRVEKFQKKYAGDYFKGKKKGKK